MSYQANNDNFDNNNNNNYDDKIGHLREEVGHVTQIMKNSCEKVLERESLLDNIESQSNDLNNDSLTFYRVSRHLKNKMFVAIICIGILLTIISLLLKKLITKRDHLCSQSYKTDVLTVCCLFFSTCLLEV